MPSFRKPPALLRTLLILGKRKFKQEDELTSVCVSHIYIKDDPVQYELKSAGKAAQHTTASKNDVHKPQSSHALAPTRPAAIRPKNVPPSTVQKTHNLSRLIARENAKRRSDYLLTPRQLRVFLLPPCANRDARCWCRQATVSAPMSPFAPRRDSVSVPKSPFAPRKCVPMSPFAPRRDHGKPVVRANVALRCAKAGMPSVPIAPPHVARARPDQRSMQKPP